MTQEELLKSLYEIGPRKTYHTLGLTEMGYPGRTRFQLFHRLVLPLLQSMEKEPPRNLCGVVDLVNYLVYGDEVRNFTEYRNDKPQEIVDDHYPYIPLPIERFIQLMDHPSLRGKKSFIDVGCGIGDKVMLASLLYGLDAEGIEYTPITYYTGKLFLKRLVYSYSRDERPRIKLHLGDALEHDFSGVDIIYMYRPMNNDQLTYRLYKHILSTMDEGAVMVEGWTGQDLDLVLQHEFNVGVRSWDCHHLKKENGKIIPQGVVK